MKTVDEIRTEEETAAIETVTVELAHREALEAEAIKNDINAKLAANGYTPNGEAIKRE